MIFNTVMGEGAAKLPEFEYTGQFQLIDDGKEGMTQNWRIKFLTSGVLTFAKDPGSIDVFLVGGGGGGARYHGVAGGGGYTKTFPSVVLFKETPYEIVIGAGGEKGNSSGGVPSAGGDTTFDTTMIANGGKGAEIGNSAYFGGDGGSGGGGALAGLGGVDGADGTGGDNPGKGQGSTTRAFEESDGELYSTGGNGPRNTTGADGQPNTGDGGCGGDGSVVSYSGGSGIAIIRNHRG